MSALFDLGSKVNVTYSTFAQKLGFSIRLTDIRAHKIDSTMLDIFEMVVATFSITDKANWVKFFKETFLVVNISSTVILGMLFLILNGVDVDFLGRKLRWRTYTTKEAFLTTRRVELVGKK